LSAGQLRTALDLQRNSGYGKLGEWLQRLGFVTEWQVTTALARQWACPILRDTPPTLGESRITSIPLLLLESFQMIPVLFAAASKKMLMAFSEGIDHTALYAVEQMLGCQTEACFVCPSILKRGLRSLGQIRAGDVVFDGVEDIPECAGIIGNYASKIGAEEIRLTRCGTYVWVRLERRHCETLNLVLRTRREISSIPSQYLPSAFVSAV
jgi:hypothetical protein